MREPILLYAEMIRKRILMDIEKAEIPQNVNIEFETGSKMMKENIIRIVKEAKL